MSAQAQRFRRPRLPLTKERRGMLAKVHLAKKELGLDDAAYRDVVTRVTGGSSAGAASDAQLHRLLGEFQRLGWTPGKPQHGKRRADQAQVRMIYAVWGDLAPFVVQHTDFALRAFVERQTRSKQHPGGVASPEFLDSQQANRVIEGLKAWLAREKSRTVSAGDRA